MIITYNGIESFKVQFGNTTLAFNPVSKKSKHKSVRFGADVALISLNHPDFNGVAEVSRGDKEPFVITGPGEYEVQGIFVKGFLSQSGYEGEKGINTIYVVSLEGMNLCFLGALGTSTLERVVTEELDGIDVLFIPIGGMGVLDPKEAHKLGVSLEAHIIIPMHYGDIGKKGALVTFLGEEGEKNGRPIEKLTLKRRDLEGKAGEIVVLNYI